MNIKPLSNRVLIEPLKIETKTPSGIIIPDNAKEKPQKGKVLAIGTKPMEVKVNDLVLFPKHGGTSIKEGDKEYLIFFEEELLAII